MVSRSQSIPTVLFPMRCSPLLQVLTFLRARGASPCGALLLLACTFWAAPADAQWSGLIYTTEEGTDTPESAESAAEDVARLGLLEVRYVQDIAPSARRQALEEMAVRAPGGLVILRIGAASGAGEGDLEDLIEQAGAAGMSPVVVLLAHCASADPGPLRQPVAAPYSLVASISPSETCSPGPDPVLQALARGAERVEEGQVQPLSDVLAGLWHQGLALPDRAVSSARSAQLTISAPSRDEGFEQILPAVFRYVPPPTADLSEIPSETLVAIPPAPGAPQPSVILGLIGPDYNSPDAQDAPDDYRDLAARTALRRQNPITFASLVSEGAFDPPAEETARAIQTELARMGCYRAGIDGIWGNGSRGAVTAYFSERSDDARAVTTEPDTALYRQIILAADVACPAPRARVTSTPSAPAPTQRAPSSQPSAPASERQIRTITPSLGVFR